MNFKDPYFHCAYGATYPASKINAKLKGNVQDMDREVHNDNNVASGHSVLSVLQFYGISIMHAKITATSTVTFNIKDVQID